jgi:hypothetical protein
LKTLHRPLYHKRNYNTFVKSHYPKLPNGERFTNCFNYQRSITFMFHTLFQNTEKMLEISWFIQWGKYDMAIKLSKDINLRYISF